MGTRTRILLGIGTVALAVVLGITVKYATRTRHPETVVVPGVRGGGLLFAYDRLRASGLRVAIPSYIPFDATSSPRVAGQTPSGGTSVDWGSVVRLRVVEGWIGSPSGPKNLPVYRVPSFGGKPLTEAVEWTHGKVLYWSSNLPPLPPSNAKHLFDAYVVTSQWPRAGLGIKLWQLNRGGVRLTPLNLQVSPRSRPQVLG
jgi:PASTA domain